MISSSLPLRNGVSWPGGASVAVALTFDVDAEAGWLCEGDQYKTRLTTLSEARFGITRGLPRVLSLLERHDVKATFFIPGETAERYPSAVHSIVDGGHELAHHGHAHLRSDRIDAAAQRREIEEALNTFEALGVPRPFGYRSPAWELTPETFALLNEFDFRYDSSCMGDDRPYHEVWGRYTILELPVHWSLDDWPRYGWNIDLGGVLGSPAAMHDEWFDEFESAAGEEGGRSLVLTMHPEVIGRSYRFVHLERWIEKVQSTHKAWFTTLEGIADHLSNTDPKA